MQATRSLTNSIIVPLRLCKTSIPRHLTRRTNPSLTQLASAAFIGILAACILHGTSSLIFVFLGISPGTASNSHTRRKSLPQELPQTEQEQEEQDHDDYYEESSSSRFSAPKSGHLLKPPRRPRADADIKTETAELLDRQWKLLRSTEKPRRRRRGLLAQTIHEESSESDFS